MNCKKHNFPLIDGICPICEQDSKQLKARKRRLIISFLICVLIIILDSLGLIRRNAYPTIKTNEIIIKFIFDLIYYVPIITLIFIICNSYKKYPKEKLFKYTLIFLIIIFIFVFLKALWPWGSQLL